MARAMLLFERQADASWLPTTVILATPKRLDGKCLPGSPDRDAQLASILQNALPPRVNDFTEERGTFEDWISWGTLDGGAPLPLCQPAGPDMPLELRAALLLTGEPCHG